MALAPFSFITVIELVSDESADSISLMLKLILLSEVDGSNSSLSSLCFYVAI